MKSAHDVVAAEYVGNGTCLETDTGLPQASRQVS